MTTLKDVAQQAGVSVATASRALGRYGYVSPETRSKVLRAARVLDYHPNALARSMVKRRTHTLGVVVSDSANPFFAAVVRGIEDVVHKHGYAVILCNADEDPQKEEMYLHILREKQVDGLLLAPSGGAGRFLRAWARQGLPLVLIDRKIEGFKADAVIVDNRNGAKEAVAHLIALGHRRIGTICGPWQVYTGFERLQGYLEALEEAKIPVEKTLIKEGNFKQDSGYHLAREFLEVHHLPTALFVANNLMTIGALLALQEAAVRIPQDMAIVGFDDMEWASILTPPLTAVAQPAYTIGMNAAQLLVQRLLRTSSAPPQEIVLKTRLVVRESCGASASPCF